MANDTRGLPLGGGRFPTVPDSAARSVAAPTEGFIRGTATTVSTAVDMSLWAGRYIKLVAIGTDIDYAWQSSATGRALITVSCAVGTASGVADRLFSSTKEHMVVPHNNYFLRYKAVSTSGTRQLRVFRS